MRSIVTIFAVILLAISCDAAQEIGDECLLKDGSTGVCKLISHCISAQNNLRRHIRPVNCGWNDLNPIVCCRQTPLFRSSYSKSDKKCLEYSNLDIKTTISTTTTTTTTATITSEENVDGPPAYAAVGGMNAVGLEFPHMALLGYGSAENRKFRCGGSLISEQFVLTAAHCLDSGELGPVSTVILGDLDIGSDSDLAEPQHFSIAQTYQHPNYDYKTVYNDIGLLKLDRPAIFTIFVKPACLQTKYKLDTNDLSAIGWGALRFGGSMYNVLQKVFINNLPITSCLKTYRSHSKFPHGINETIQICSGDLAGEMDTCQGDSGGPLQFKIKDSPLTYKIVGITSSGIFCGLAPSIYTRVSYYISWIENIVWPN